MRPSLPGPSAMSLLVLAALSAAGGAAALGFGVHCFTQPDPGIECAALVTLGPLLAFPLSGGFAIFGAARAGWLVRAEEDKAGE